MVIASGYHEQAGGLLLLAAATETGLLTQLEQTLPPSAVPSTPACLPLAGSATVRRRLLLTVLFLEAVGLSRTWDLRGYTADGLALLTGRTRAYGYRYTEQSGPEHPDMADPLNNLAIIYFEQGRYAEAEPLYQRALRIREQRLGPEHPRVAYPLNNLANLYKEQGRYAEAEPLYQRALRIFEQQWGPEHPETAEVLYDFASFQVAQDHRPEALSLYHRALQIRERVFGTSHPKTTETRNCLIALLHTLEQHEEAAKLEATQFES